MGVANIGGVGACGSWCDGMEVSELPTFSGVGGIECIRFLWTSYGLNMMYIQGVENVYDLDWDGVQNLKVEKTTAIFSTCRSGIFWLEFERPIPRCSLAISGMLRLKWPALSINHWHCPPKSMYKAIICLTCWINGVISVTERAAYIGRVRPWLSLAVKLGWLGSQPMADFSLN